MFKQVTSKMSKTLAALTIAATFVVSACSDSGDGNALAENIFDKLDSTGEPSSAAVKSCTLDHLNGLSDEDLQKLDDLVEQDEVTGLEPGEEELFSGLVSAFLDCSIQDA